MQAAPLVTALSHEPDISASRSFEAHLKVTYGRPNRFLGQLNDESL